MSERADRRFVVVSGLPGSGKSTLASKLAPLLNLPVIDKDDLLERLFETRGMGERRTLSREADGIFRQEAEASNGAILVSFWRLPGMPPESGTPTDWLKGLSDRIVNVHCECPIEVAAKRFSARKRHAGHLDETRSEEEVLASIRSASQSGQLKIGLRLTLDTAEESEATALAGRILKAFEPSEC